jgi:dynein heavy chain
MSFLKELEKSMDQLDMKKHETHENFRLWLSSSPHPKFPISILQKCIKVTTEPPKGVKANMFRMYSNMAPDKYARVQNKGYYKKLVFSLCWFHALIIERKRFRSLGWNVIYDFNDSDWDTADNILQMYVDQTSSDK